jgi:cation transport ATPase
MADNCSGQYEDKSDDKTYLHSIQSRNIDSNYVSEFTVSKMDCASEECMIRMSLENIRPSVALEFDFPSRKIKVFHEGNLDEIQRRIESLNLSASLNDTRKIGEADFSRRLESVKTMDKKEAVILKWLLVINATMFAIELFVGWFAQSTALIADSLDMFADAAVYSLALYAVGRSIHRKLQVAHLSGWIQMILALGVLSEVLRRFILGSEPVSTLMMSFGLIALIANIICLMLIFNHKEGGAHMKASWIFSANDVIASFGVIMAGFLVALTGSPYPDLVIGLVIGLIVLNGARRILRLES